MTSYKYIPMKKHLLSAFAFLLAFTLVAQKNKNNYTFASQINVMTFNLRYDGPNDGENSWVHRKDGVTKTILLNNVDILGAQEVLHNQLIDLEKALPDYTWIGVGREDGIEKGEYSPIFYNHNKFTEIGSGYFWLSQTPFAAGSKGWDAACERIATWAKLKDNASGIVFFVLNTHFDHIGQVAREESVKLILDKINLYTRKQQLPTLVLGDFNATPTSTVVKMITDKTNPLHLTDARLAAPKVSGPAWSFHDFGRVPVAKRELIDYVFVRNNVNVLLYEVIDNTKGGTYTSDHCAVVVKVKL